MLGNVKELGFGELLTERPVIDKQKRRLCEFQKTFDGELSDKKMVFHWVGE